MFSSLTVYQARYVRTHPARRPPRILDEGEDHERTVQLVSFNSESQCFELEELNISESTNVAQYLGFDRDHDLFCRFLHDGPTLKS